MELVSGAENTILGVLHKCVLVRVIIFTWLGPANYPSVHHKCGVLTYTAVSPLCRVA
jgi:hypothetical protein